MGYLVSAFVCVVLVMLTTPSEISFKFRLEIAIYAVKRRFKTNKKPGTQTPDK